jgi:hypothetical protein
MALFMVSVSGQETDYQVVVVDYRELRLVPEDFSILTNTYPIFNTNPELNEIINKNSTLFWEPIGRINSGFLEDSSFSTFAIIEINETGFFETVIGLSTNNQSLEWITPLNSSVAANFSEVILSATDFFASDAIYWGLCEEIVVIPGSLIGLDIDALWRLAFHLVAESEQWTIYVDVAGNLIDSSFVTIPCPLCPVCPFVIIGLSAAITICGVVIVILRRRANAT